ncbi:MAG TPA: hypothetical protein VLJ68_12865 [Chitinophagaceae bacterium]|nr:hypothetical protein [Chitinophagaceae bacterium]
MEPQKPKQKNSVGTTKVIVTIIVLFIAFVICYFIYELLTFTGSGSHDK